jgi:hypothetical protein
LSFSRFTTEEPAMMVRDWISLAGLVVSVIGFSVVIWQFTRAANAREETRPAIGWPDRVSLADGRPHVALAGRNHVR